MILTGRYRTFILLSGFLSLRAFPQGNGAAGYFPLGPGDTWQYHKYYTTVHPVEYFSTYYIVRIAPDSLMPNGMRYVHLEGMPNDCPVGNGYFRFDTASACVFRYVETPGPGELLYDSLGAGPGDEFPGLHCPRIFLRQDTVDILGTRTNQRDYHPGWVPFFPAWSIAAGFGLVRRSEVAGNDPIDYLITDELVYAKVDGVEHGELVGLPRERPTVPSCLSLAQNYPNPFNPTTEIRFSLPVRGTVELTVLNILGQHVATLAGGEWDAGEHTVTLDGSNLSTGIYVYRLRAGGVSLAKKLVIAK